MRRIKIFLKRKPLWGLAAILLLCWFAYNIARNRKRLADPTAGSSAISAVQSDL